MQTLTFIGIWILLTLPTLTACLIVLSSLLPDPIHYPLCGGIGVFVGILSTELTGHINTQLWSRQ